MFHTREDLMTSGTIKFYVDDVECPDTSGVGVNAIGGVFNCGLTGTSFKVKCTTACDPNFAVQEIKLWNDKAVSLKGTPYRFEGNVDSPYENVMDKVFETGSYVSTASEDNIEAAYATSKGTESMAVLGLTLAEKA